MHRLPPERKSDFLTTRATSEPLTVKTGLGPSKLKSPILPAATLEQRADDWASVTALQRREKSHPSRGILVQCFSLAKVIHSESSI